MSKDFFLNIMIVLFPVLFYQVFLYSPNRKRTKRNKRLIGLLGGLSAVLCVQFPFVDGYGIYWDFRMIPLALATMYGGFTAGALAFVMEVSFRLWVGGPMAWFSILFQTVVFSSSIWFLRKNRFLRMRPSQRVAILTVFSMVEYTAFLGLLMLVLDTFTEFSFREESAKHVGFLLLIGLLQAAVMALAALIIENQIATSRLRTEVQRTEKLGVVSELAASVAHEIRNPLTAVRGLLQLVRGNLDTKNQQYMKTAIAELDRAEFIIGDYLNFAKPQVESVFVFDAAKELHDAVTLMSTYALLRGVKLDVHIESGLWVKANQEKLKQAALHLLKNSIEACQDSGDVTIRAYYKHARVVIQVLDTGIGMDDEQVKLLGRPFHSTKESGSGLGLMVTFRIVEVMNGQLTFKSKPGVGTQATIQLPAAAPATSHFM